MKVAVGKGARETWQGKRAPGQRKVAVGKSAKEKWHRRAARKMKQGRGARARG